MMGSSRREDNYEKIILRLWIGVIIYGYLNSGSINAGRTAVVSVYVFILATMIASCIKQVVLEIKDNK